MTEKQKRKAESKRMTGKEDISSTECPEGEDTIYTERAPASQQGEMNYKNICIAAIYFKCLMKMC